jgi:hypothetical protein
MLDPDLVSAAFAAGFQGIPALTAVMGTNPPAGGDPTRPPGSSNIYSHIYSYGQEDSLARAIFQMTSPSILIAYKDYLGGNFSQETLWKHRLEVYIRPPNAAPDPTTGLLSGPSTPHIAWLAFNSPVNGQFPVDGSGPPGSWANIRQLRLMRALLPMDVPTLTHRQDESLSDFFVWSVTIPEIGDEGIWSGNE